MLTRHYRQSPLSQEDWPASQHTTGRAAGDRAPDTVLLLLRPGYKLLLFTKHKLLSLADEISHRYQELVEPVLVVPAKTLPAVLSGTRHRVILDGDRALHDRYGAAKECLYLIRPDGYIGYRSLPANDDKLRAYLQRIFLF